MRRTLSSLNPVFYFLIVRARRAVRCLQWWFGDSKYAQTLQNEKLPFSVFSDRAVLIRKQLKSDTNLLRLQRNRIINVNLDLQKINGIIIRPGETFSYFYLTGRAAKRQGYVGGTMLSNGKIVESVGGGVCFITNLIHWLCLNSPLTVKERHPHSINLYPDEEGSAPFGSDATIFYNYIDYQFTNDTSYTFQLLFWHDAKYLYAELRVSERLPYTYNVFEKNHLLFKKGDHYYRTNELWRVKTSATDSRDAAKSEFLQKNFALIKYQPETYSLYKNLTALEKDIADSTFNFSTGHQM